MVAEYIERSGADGRQLGQQEHSNQQRTQCDRSEGIANNPRLEAPDVITEDREYQHDHAGQAEFRFQSRHAEAGNERLFFGSENLPIALGDDGTLFDERLGGHEMPITRIGWDLIRGPILGLGRCIGIHEERRLERVHGKRHDPPRQIGRENAGGGFELVAQIFHPLVIIGLKGRGGIKIFLGLSL